MNKPIPLAPHERVVVAIGTDADPASDIATVVIGIPEAAYSAIVDGRTHTVSLTQYGLPVQIVIFREKDTDACRQLLGETAATLGLPTDQLPNVGIGGKS